MKAYITRSCTELARPRMAFPTARMVVPTHNMNGTHDTSQKTKCEQPLKLNLINIYVKQWVFEWCKKYHPEAFVEAEKFVRDFIEKEEL